MPTKWTTTRLETWAIPGVPDVLLCDEAGAFHFLELKTTGTKAVALSPHQVAWLTRHGHASVWVLVERSAGKERPRSLYLFHGRDAVALRMDGADAVEPVGVWQWPPPWEEVLALTCRS